jgi:hypothetical protein
MISEPVINKLPHAVVLPIVNLNVSQQPIIERSKTFIEVQQAIIQSRLNNKMVNKLKSLHKKKQSGMNDLMTTG